MKSKQIILSQDQIAAFYHDQFAENQVEHFIALLGDSIDPPIEKVVDIGGGCGFFAKTLHERTHLKVNVLDSDIQSINFCKQEGIDAINGDALNPAIVGDENIVCFNLILHHLVGKSEHETYKMQGRALSVWHSTARAIFIHEQSFESFFIGGISGWLIYQITSDPVLSKLCKLVAKFVPSLKANTFGVGVRFRSHEEWCRIFVASGFEVVGTKIGRNGPISLPRRLLLIKNIRYDSFLIKPIISVSQDNV